MVTTRWVMTSAFGGLVILGAAVAVSAQGADAFTGALLNTDASLGSAPVARLASFPPGSIQGTVVDEKGQPVSGAVVSAVGGSTVVAVTDQAGHFELRSLVPGPYLVRAHLAGFVTPPAKIVQVRSSVRTGSSIALRHAGASPTPVLAAGFGASSSAAADPSPAADSDPLDKTDDGKSDEGETAWRLRHTRRSILKDLTLPSDVLADSAPPSTKTAGDFLSHAPFSGQFDLLTASSLDDGQQLFTPNHLPAGVANLSVTAPIGEHADWIVRGAFTQADMAAWIVSGAYQTRAPARHQYHVGASYSTQRYDVGNPLALNAATNSRSASNVFAFDTFTLSPLVAITYGTQYARYDYLDGGRGLASPKFEVALSPSSRFRIRTLLAQAAQAPGAEEFLPPSDTGVWLPPQRLFSPLDPEAGLRAEHTTHAALAVERDFGTATVALSAFHQHTDDQMVTLFGTDVPDQPISKLGHYFVGNAGNAVASGCAASVRAAITSWLRASVEYAMTMAQLSPTADVRYLMLTAPSAVGPRAERIHDVSTTLEAKVPETSTRVVVLYRVGDGYARPASSPDPAADHTGIDSRYDVQVRQALPFMNFTSAKWEMLVGVRNFFQEPGADVQSAYDELLVVRPPKRIVGGLTMQF